MSLALISLSKDTQEGSGPVGLLPLFDGYVVDQQVRTAIEAGADQLILICPTMNGAVLHYVDRLQRDGIDIQLVRSGKDLVQFAEPDGQILFFGDGILPGKALIEQISHIPEEAIFVVNDAEEYADFERIDLNHRWLGVASLNASRLSGFIDLPEDWDVGSALLRGAVQSECERQIVRDADFADGAISYLRDESVVVDYAKNQLGDLRFKKGNFLERLVVWPLSCALLPRIWKTSDAGRTLGWSAAVIGLIAGVLTYFSISEVATFSFLLIAAFLLTIRANIALFSNYTNRLDGIAILGYALIGLVTASTTIRESSPVTLAPNIVIFLLSFGTLVLIGQGRIKSKWDWIKPEIMLMVSILLCFSAFGSFFAGLYFSGLLGMVFLLGNSLSNLRNA